MSLAKRWGMALVRTVIVSFREEYRHFFGLVVRVPMAMIAIIVAGPCWLIGCAAGFAAAIARRGFCATWEYWK